MATISVKKILAQWLKEHGYDGLYNKKYGDEGCGCFVDDLCSCGDEFNLTECTAGYKVGVSIGPKKQDKKGDKRGQ